MTTFVGWLRTLPAGRWKPVVTGFTQRICTDRLVRYRAESDACEKIVLPAGKTPTKRRKPR